MVDAGTPHSSTSYAQRAISRCPNRRRKSSAPAFVTVRSRSHRRSSSCTTSSIRTIPVPVVRCRCADLYASTACGSANGCRSSSTITVPAGWVATSIRTTPSRGSTRSTPTRSLSPSTTVWRPNITFPAAVDDALAAVEWASRSCRRRCADGDALRLAALATAPEVALATVVCQIARDRGHAAHRVSGAAVSADGSPSRFDLTPPSTRSAAATTFSARR